MDLAVAPRQLSCSERLVLADQSGPMVADVSAGGHHLVVAVTERAIVGDRIDCRECGHRIVSGWSVGRGVAAKVEGAGVLALDGRGEPVEFGDIGGAGGVAVPEESAASARFGLGGVHRERVV